MIWKIPRLKCGYHYPGLHEVGCVVVLFDIRDGHRSEAFATGPTKERSVPAHTLCF